MLDNINDGYIGMLSKDIKNEINKYLENDNVYEKNTNIREIMNKLNDIECKIRIYGKDYGVNGYYLYDGWYLEVYLTGGMKLYITRHSIYMMRAQVCYSDLKIKLILCRIRRTRYFRIKQQVYAMMTENWFSIIQILIIVIVIIKMMGYKIEKYEV